VLWGVPSKGGSSKILVSCCVVTSGLTIRGIMTEIIGNSGFLEESHTLLMLGFGLIAGRDFNCDSIITRYMGKTTTTPSIAEKWKSSGYVFEFKKKVTTPRSPSTPS